MTSKREASDLRVEDLESRVAPVTIIYTEPLPEETLPGAGGGSGDPPIACPAVEPDQPGNSDFNRDKMWKKTPVVGCY